MVLPKKTTRDLIGEYIDLDIERQWEEDNEAQLEIENQLHGLIFPICSSFEAQPIHRVA